MFREYVAGGLIVVTFVGVLEEKRRPHLPHQVIVYNQPQDSAFTQVSTATAGTI